jgi:hypothetical protein
LNQQRGQVPVAHACNPRYSGGRDQEDWGVRPGWGNSLQDPILKIPNTKNGLVECLPSKCKALSSKLQYCQKKAEGKREALDKIGLIQQEWVKGEKVSKIKGEHKAPKWYSRNKFNMPVIIKKITKLTS